MNDIPKTFSSHLDEIRRGLVFVMIFFAVAFCVAYKNAPVLLELLFYPLKSVGEFKGTVIYTSVPEAFLSEINIAVFFAILASLPILLLRIYSFVKPALYATERVAAAWVFLSVPALFYGGALFAQMTVLPRAMRFFAAFEHDLNLKFTPKLSEYIGFCERFMVVFGLGFELPVLLAGMVVFNVIELKTLKKNWRIVVFCVCATSAAITPPDALSMLVLAVPLIFLYGATVFVLGLRDNFRNRRAPE